MTQSTLLEQLRDANKGFLSGLPRLLDADGEPFVVLACIDHRLTGLLEPALGLPRRRALVVRTAGNQLNESCQDALRSIAAAVFLRGAKAIFVVGHTDCALSTFSTTDVIDSFRKAGIPRSAFGDRDLRSWFGAFADVGTNVVQTVEFLRQSALLPQSIPVHGLILGIEDGNLEVLVNGDLASVEPPPVARTAAVEGARAFVSEPIATAHSVSGAPPPPPPPPLPESKKPIVITAAEAGKQTVAGAPPATMLDAVTVFRDVFRRERRDKRFERSLADFRAFVKREKNPAAILQALERSVKEYEGQYPNLPAALAYCRSALGDKGAAGLRFAELMKRLLE